MDRNREHLRGSGESTVGSAKPYRRDDVRGDADEYARGAGQEALSASGRINKQRDSLELLKGFLAAMPETQVHVIRNLYFGPEAKFELSTTARSVKRSRRGEAGAST